jgi:hypothetical protein
MVRLNFINCDSYQSYVENFKMSTQNDRGVKTWLNKWCSLSASWLRGIIYYKLLYASIEFYQWKAARTTNLIRYVPKRHIAVSVGWKPLHTINYYGQAHQFTTHFVALRIVNVSWRICCCLLRNWRSIDTIYHYFVPLPTIQWRLEILRQDTFKMNVMKP